MFHYMCPGMLVLYLFDVDMLRVTFVYLIFAMSVVEVSAVSLNLSTYSDINNKVTHPRYHVHYNKLSFKEHSQSH